MSLSPGDPLVLDASNRDALGHYAKDLTFDLENQYRASRQARKVLWDLYYARPLTQRRTFPWDNASNIVVPIIRTASDALASKYVQQVLSPRHTWVASTNNEQWRDKLPAWLDYQNWAADGNVFDIFEPSWSCISEMVPLGTGYLQLGWAKKIVTRYVPGKANRGAPVQVEISRGPTVEHVPGDMLMHIPGYTIQESPVVIRQRWLSRTEMIQFASSADWDPETVDYVLDHPDDRPSQASILGPEGNVRAGYGANAPIDQYDIRELWVDWPTLRGSGVDPKVLHFDEVSADRPPCPVVLTIHPATGKLLRAIAHPYFFSHWPFYDLHYRKSAGRGDSDGVALMLEHIQAGVTTMTNQSVDALTLANSVNFATTDRDLYNQRFAPNRPMFVREKEGIIPLNLSKQVVPDLQMMNFLIGQGERLTSVSDPALGHETKMGGRPSPATSTLLMLQQLEQNSTPTIRLMRNRFSQIGEDIATLFQQFETDEDGRIGNALGEHDAQIVKELFLPMDSPVSGNVFFDMAALSETTNPDKERSTAVLVDQALTGYYSQLLQLAQIQMNPQLQSPMIQEVAFKAMLAKTESMKRILASSDIDDVESYVIEMQDRQQQGMGIGGQPQQQLLAQIQQQLEQRLRSGGAAPGAPGPVSLGAVGGPPAGAFPGAGRPNGAAGSGL
jgi:hypothetical protein